MGRERKGKEVKGKEGKEGKGREGKEGKESEGNYILIFGIYTEHYHR